MEKPWLEIPERDGCNRYLAQAWMDSSDSGESVMFLWFVGLPFSLACWTLLCFLIGVF